MAVAPNTPLLSRLVSASIAIANHAGGVIREVMKRGELGIVEKENARDLQTEADRAAQRCIISSLSKCFPKITIIGLIRSSIDKLRKKFLGSPIKFLVRPSGGEEGEEESKSTSGIFDPASVPVVNINCPTDLSTLCEEEIVVWVDPLDGTSEYTQGLLDHVTVLIGIASGGKALGGVIHQPYYNYQNPGADLGRTVWGVVGGDVGGMAVQPPPEGKLIVTTTRSHSSVTVNDAISAVGPDEVLRVGGAGHKVMLLLEGKAHIYVFASPGCKKWDTCAPQAVLEAAGGLLTDIQGSPIPYHSAAPHRNSTGVLATAAGLHHDTYIGKIPQNVKDNLKA